jgi:methionine synthase II (cobalamin-independent)
VSKFPQTTGIGSLPHHNVDAALEFSFRMGIPFLPQIPVRNPWEYMIAQALEGLPGLECSPDGSAFLNTSVWESRTAALKKNLEEAFTLAGFERFEPHPSASSSWQAFLFEIEERKTPLVKAQIAGPLTSQWALRLKEQSRPDQVPGLADQVFRLVLARAIATIRRLKSLGPEVIFFLDEPGLYGLSRDNAKHILGLSELKIMTQSLAQEGAIVGLHCCSNTDWDLILDLTEHGLKILSIDAGLSLPQLLGLDEKPHESSQKRATRVERFLLSGGRLSLGVIPTARSSVLRSMKAKDHLENLLEIFKRAWPEKRSTQKLALESAVFTPACGLAFHSVDDAELVLENLTDFTALARKSF